MNDRFCLNTATIKTTPLDLQIDLAREAGFRQIGLWLKDVEAAMEQGKSLGEIKATWTHAGLRVAEFCFLGGWQDANEPRIKEVLSQTHHICKVSRGLGCEIVVTVPALGPGWLKGAPERFRQVCQVAAEYGLRIALEFPGIARGSQRPPQCARSGFCRRLPQRRVDHRHLPFLPGRVEA